MKLGCHTTNWRRNYHRAVHLSVYLSNVHIRSQLMMVRGESHTSGSIVEPEYIALPFKFNIRCDIVMLAALQYMGRRE